MAQLIANPSTNTHPLISESLLSLLQEHLPADFLILPQVAWEVDGQTREIPLLLLSPSQLVVVGVSSWYGRITGRVDSKRWQVGQLKKPQLNPLLALAEPIQWVREYLTRPEMLTALAKPADFVPHIVPAIFFTHAQAQIEVENPGHALLATEPTALASWPANEAVMFSPVELDWLVKGLVTVDEPQTHEAVAEQPLLNTAESNQLLDEMAVLALEGLQVDQTAEEEVPAAEPDVFVHLPSSKSSKPARRPKAPRPSLFKQLVEFVARFFNGIEEGIGTVEKGMQPQLSRFLSPDQLAQALENEMEKTRCSMMEDTIARNHYVVFLSSVDYGQNKPILNRWKQKTTTHLQRVMQSRGYLLIGPLQIDIVEKLDLPAGGCVIESALVEGEAVPEATLVLDGIGQVFSLKPEVVTKIGRSEQADICVSPWDPKSLVSRLHARIQPEGGSYVLYDGDRTKESKLGTFINGQVVKKGEGVQLRPGDKIQLGKPQSGRGNGLTLTFQV